MKKGNFLLTAVLAAALSFGALAQDLPKPSPKATITQTVGLTDISVEYSSPAVAGRQIWGDLVAYDELWRTGANAATTIAFSKDVTIEGTTVPAGKYALFTIPSKNEWTIILNKDTNQGGTRGYKEEDDLLRIKAKPVEAPLRERFAVLITDFNNEEATVSIEWEKLRIPFKVKLNTHEQAMANISQSMEDNWRSFANSARYLLENKKDMDKALELANTSVSLQSHWYNNWIKAQILAEKKQMKEAIKAAKIAKDLGDKDSYFFWKANVEKALAEWK
ncbi:DUF2911 domain-containing protein [Cytophagaceae bacterium ABcell3]|nr:DUF2911 domain-containing protein [Cytophagaceae bacterium ABcell3]